MIKFFADEQTLHEDPTIQSKDVGRI